MGLTEPISLALPWKLNLRAVPRGYGGLIKVATSLVNEAEEAETAEIHSHDNGMVTSDDDSDTVSVSNLCTLTVSSSTLSASKLDVVSASKLGEFFDNCVNPVLLLKIDRERRDWTGLD